MKVSALATLQEEEIDVTFFYPWLSLAVFEKADATVFFAGTGVLYYFGWVQCRSTLTPL